MLNYVPVAQATASASTVSDISQPRRTWQLCFDSPRRIDSRSVLCSERAHVRTGRVSKNLRKGILKAANGHASLECLDVMSFLDRDAARDDLRRLWLA